MDRVILRGRTKEEIINAANNIFESIAEFDLDDSIDVINEIRESLSKYSPFKDEPVDCVRWVLTSEVEANDYNPNSVAPPEMKLLTRSISEDGFTQPVVSWKVKSGYEVVDGFHRNRVARECKEVIERTKGYLPVVIINSEREDRGDRIASTIRHNRARGKHKVDSMSDIVVELKRRNWSPKKIAKELGMDQDEVLRLAQISGLAEMFADQDFSEAWEADNLDERDYDEN